MFIELTYYGKKILLNTKDILSVHEHYDGKCLIETSNNHSGNFVSVQESYKQVLSEMSKLGLFNGDLQ